MLIRRTIFAFSSTLTRIMRAHTNLSIVAKVVIALSPCSLLVVGQEFLSDIVSFILYTYLVFSIKTPIWILARVFRVQKVSEAKFDWNSRKWGAWWFSAVVMGFLSFGYWILKKYLYGVATPADMFSPYNMTFWMLLVALSGYYATGLNQRDYLINAFHFDDTDFKRNKLDFQTYVLPEHMRTVKEMITGKAGKKAYYTYEKASVLLGLSIGFFAILPGIMFHGGALFLDIIVLMLMVYSLVVNPERMSSYEEEFYLKLISNFRNPISASKVLTFTSLCSLAGLQILEWNGDFILFSINLALISFALVSMAKFFPKRISGIVPFFGTLLICLMCILNSFSLHQTIGYSLIPILTFLLLKVTYSLLDLQARKGSVTKTLVYVFLSVIVFVTCTFLLTLGSKEAFLLLIVAGSFLGLVMLLAVLGGEI